MDDNPPVLPEVDAVCKEEDYDEADGFVDPFLAAEFPEQTEEPDVPMLFEGCRMSTRCFLAKLHYLKAKHKMCDVAVGDLLTLFREALPSQNSCPGTVYMLSKATEEEFGSPALEFERICSVCFSPLGDDNKCQMQGCNYFDNPQQASHGFGKIGLKWQIQRILHGLF